MTSASEKSGKKKAGDVDASVLTCGVHMSVAKRKKRAHVHGLLRDGLMLGHCLRTREEEKAGLAQLGSPGYFFCFKSFSFSFSVKQIKQKQNKAKFNQTNFVEFVKINSTALVTTNKQVAK